MLAYADEASNVVLLHQNSAASISWGTFKKNLKVPLIRRADLSLHKPFQRFVFHIAAGTNPSAKAFKSRLRSVGYALLEYETFLESIGKKWIDADDKLLVMYRDYSFERVKGSKTSRGETTGMRTTNVKLRVLYELYCWAASSLDERTPSIGSGNDVAIRSTLPLHVASPNKWNSMAKKLFPQCFHDAGEGSSSMSGQHWATNAELNDIEDYFRWFHGPATADRNVLFMRLVDQTGLRLESANCLKIGQFSDDSIEKSIHALPSHMIQPSKQKFGGRNYFDVPFALSWGINRYIKSIYGEDIFVRAIYDKAVNDLPLFMSSTTGLSMCDSTWTDIFTQAFHAIDCPRGSGLHSIRRKFAEAWFMKEVQRCIDQGLPVVYNDIVAGLAKVLGQESKLSQEAYRRASSMSRVVTPLDELTEQNRELNAGALHLNAQLREKDDEIARLREQLANIRPAQKTKRRANFPA